jgi:hypothetical protein
MMRVARALVVSVGIGVGAVAAHAAPAPASLAMRTPPAAPAAHDGFVEDMDCSACHTADGWQLAAIAGASGFDHDRTGFALRGAHVQTRCTGCHAGRGKPATSCDGCHRDPHQGRNDGTCAECHAATAWSDTQTLEQHRRTRMPLTGRHAMIDCTACHRRTGERALSDLPADCYGCHRTEFHAITVHPVHDGKDGSAAFSRDCGLCHRTTGWQPAIANPRGLMPLISGSAARAVGPASPAGPAASLVGSLAGAADHDARFTLTTGSHRAAACAACHPDARRAQRVRCDACHDDVSLRTQHRAPVSRSASGCLSCHPRGAARGASVGDRRAMQRGRR